ncbi:MAG: hypothetical protein LBF28_01970, partial [Rickettsiales bacterium]|nr:hypothetical protein [Rickettsiales bacterium]
IPIICAYLDITDKRLKPNPSLYPAALATRINNETAKTIHIPFHKDVIKMVIGQFSPDKLPNGSASTYVDKYYDRIGL